MKTTKKLALSAMFLALGIVLPFLTGQIREIGNTLLPMHVPVLLCGLICGWQYGLTIGFILPLLRSAAFGMPPLYPSAIAMAFELAAYGFVSGFLYARMHQKNLATLYGALLSAMVLGRLVWGLAEIVLLGLRNDAFTFEAFLSGAVLKAIPGIIIQLVLIPAIMLALGKAGLVKFKKQ